MRAPQLRGPVCSFLLDLTAHPDSIRNVAIAGHLHHGKTSLVDMLVYETHKVDWNADKRLRYTDPHVLSQARGISLKCSPMSLVLQTTKGKSHLINMMDTPGHVNFQVRCHRRCCDSIGELTMHRTSSRVQPDWSTVSF
jgi:translation elongation factor EF-G